MENKRVSFANNDSINDTKRFDLNIPIKISNIMHDKFIKYSIDTYIEDVNAYGLEETWNNICNYVIQFGESKKLLSIQNFGELYEIGLAIQDKTQKKKSGQYYTPDDVALVMSKWLYKCEGSNICDVGCGTGKLILTYLDYIGYDSAKKILNEGRLYLYDFDKIALKICKTSLLIKYGLDLNNKIHVIYGDFLSNKISLPKNCKTISNPPYAAIHSFANDWSETDVLKESRELYSAFMEKIFDQSKSAVIITPFSFVSGKKFYSLRKKMCEIGNGFIVTFDNVPGNIFSGRKHGIFNTNTSNSVRAAITVVKNDKKNRGYKVSPMIRFKNEERKKLLQCEVLESILPDRFQLVDDKKVSFEKVAKELEEIFNDWTGKSIYTVNDLILTDKTEFSLYIPNTCRYNTTASSKKLSRNGLITIGVGDEDTYNFLYCFINSSFAYWWWRIYDGGITYPIGLLKKMPVPMNLLSEDDKLFFKKISEEMIKNEMSYLATKTNSGLKQENIKFPEIYINKINDRILNIIGHSKDHSIFKIIHTNKFF